MLIAVLVFNMTAALFGVVGAILWWIGSSREKRNLEAFIHWKLVRGPDDTPSHHEATFPYLDRIGRWNRWAAVATGISVIAGAMPNLFRLFF